jgi:rubrerythrin
VPTYHISAMDPVSSNTGGPVSSEAIPHQQLHFDEPWAEVEEDRIETGLALRGQLKRTSDNRHPSRKRLRTAELDPGAGPSHRTDEAEDQGGVEPLNTSTKRRRVTMERKTEDRVAAQRGETQELRARRTSAATVNKSKLGNRSLRKETLAVPSQGVYPPFSPRPTTGATLGPTDFADQAWTWTEGTQSERIFEGTENVHDDETDEKWNRLMVLEEGEWKCSECPGKTFFDRSTLRRHCKTVHGSECDRWKCPQCPDKSYSRKSGLDRHTRAKHQGGA